MKDIIPCYCCGNDCYKQDSSAFPSSVRMSVCQACAFELQPENKNNTRLYDLSDPKDGNGYPYTAGWAVELDTLKLKKTCSFLNRPLSGFKPSPEKKVYTDLCPCGIHPSQCDYHRS